ncbi:MAG: asparaginase [Spirochaetes bacterium GWD1_61_31]|nr:MAG: asparaginase [Spirochaetes bacterium GWB1_60_80]OHD29080.1 MAG: asparaginase [Spirochaetes bacterium GWC1_61_12]OHD43111.1 MAG: asparaginase [Spirochaetes bacterium GWD1_61_31]OHD44245.1 MAG: asparaginase [Spirochaetes bacterium GWE1_60_18]OHD60395.1 MAG: asparaginase [Spirochaetes bacterium GWF1_60_12]HAP43289.1 asparaginase [Spirochaetaceae bacterium]
MNDDPVRLIITGGTFDKHYDELKGELTFKESNLPDIIKQVRIVSPVEFELLQLIDSLQMTDDHRARILEACRNAPEHRLVITHGTDRMAETARYLGPAGLNKTIVLTGAMIPFKISGSDSLFNLGTAFMAARLLPPGVYVAMNGRSFPWQDVRKDYARGVFRPAEETASA